MEEQMEEYVFKISKPCFFTVDMLPRNVHLFKWLPQSDLLRHPRTKVFITHGGYNSIQVNVSSSRFTSRVP
ncbi:hypothetical protein ANCDUO_16020 [Ancylostoma duodenale]|uniref:glucuronosyltransferase n=1 Tax=Ancylostoma duodenale TaxID=51022 RepID=A0A0C2G4H9_9BILA|nr:hypothetical protein ANCDUO_16020 [Ancylostoma duodenale]